MKITIKGFTSLEKVGGIMTEVISTMGERIGVPEGTEIKIEGLEFKVVYMMDGQERYATVPREVDGETTHEIFEVAVSLNADGDIDITKDNEEESFYDGYTMAKALGKEYHYEGIESGYADSDLMEIDRLTSNEEEDVQVIAIKYDIKGTLKELIRHYKGELLVAEYVLEDKEIKA